MVILSRVLTTTPTNICFVINLITGAVTLWTNVGILGSSLMPPASPYKALAVVESAPGQTDVIDLSSLFSTSTMTTNDMFTCNGYTSGPDFYVETKKYDISDPQIKKLMKQMMLHFKCDGGNLALDTVVGLNTTGATSSSVFADSNSAFVDKRIKFLKRTQYIQFRIYKASAGTKDIWLGPWAIGYKFQRPGRV